MLESDAAPIDVNFLTAWIQKHSTIPCTLFVGASDFSTGVVVRDILASICGHQIPGTISTPQSTTDFINNYTSILKVLSDEYSTNKAFPSFVNDPKTPERLVHVCFIYLLCLNNFVTFIYEEY